MINESRNRLICRIVDCTTFLDFCKVNRNPRSFTTIEFGVNLRAIKANTGIFAVAQLFVLAPACAKKKWKSFLALSCTRSHSNRESRSPLAGSHSIGRKCAPSSAYKCGPLSIFPSVIYTCLLLVSAVGTSQIIPREKTRTKIETRQSCKRE